MQPKDIIYNLENLSTPVINQYLDYTLEVNTRSAYFIPGLFNLGIPDVSQRCFSTASIKNVLILGFKTANNFRAAVPSRYVLVPHYFTFSRGVIIAHCNGVVTPVVVVAKNKRSKEYGLYIDTNFLTSSVYFRSLNTAFNKFKLDWILAGYGLLTKKEIDKCFITPTIPTFSSIKDMKSWEESIKEEIYNEALAS